MSNPDYDRDMREELAGDGPPLPSPAPDDEETTLARARREMVSSQLVARGIRDPRVLATIERIPRHRFLPRAWWPAAYEDRALPLPEGQTISQPYMVAIMSELLHLQGNERVLEIGTGSGYQTAVLAELAAEVYSIERVAELSARGLQNLSNLGYNMASKLHLAVGDGSIGWPDAAPFDAILVTAGAPTIPKALAAQLKDGGRLIIPVGKDQQQMLVALRLEDGALIEKSLMPCMFVPLIGEQGWQSGMGDNGDDEQNV